MKKLINAAVAVAMAVVANAAQIKWQTTYEVCNGPSENLTSATFAYLVDATTMSQDAIYNAVMAGASLSEVVSGVALKSAAMSEGAISTQTIDLPASYTAGSKLNAYMVLFDEDLNALYFSEQKSGTLQVASATGFGFTNDSSLESVMADMSGFDKSYGGWVSTAAVPEPTSGLLMLLGMAGLALRRRRS